MTDTTNNGGDAAAAAAAAAAAKPVWHTGVDPDTLGFWQNKGYPIDDAKGLALKLTEQYRAAERHIGAPPDQIVRLPKADAKPEDVKAFRMRLGMPGEAKEYDFTTVKTAAGEAIPDALADSLRTAAHNAGLSKEAAATMAASVVKHMDDAASAAATVAQTKIDEERSILKKNWGVNFDFNLLKAMEGVRRLGITPEAVKALEGQIGYAAVMDAMRKIGAGTSEDTFVERGTGSGAVGPTTQAGAVSKKNELMADAGFRQRFLGGGQAERREMEALDRLISGVMEVA